MRPPRDWLTEGGRGLEEPAAGYRFREGLQTLLINAMLGGVGVSSSAVAVALSNSGVLRAELLRSLTELTAVLISLALFLVARRLRAETAARLARIAAIAVAAAMLVALVVILIHAWWRTLEPVATTGVGSLIGIATAAVSALVNFQAVRRNRRMYLEQRSVLFASQWRLFRVKLAANLTIVATVAASCLGGHLPWLRYCDPIGSLILAGFIAYSAAGVLATAAARGLSGAIPRRSAPRGPLASAG